MKKWLPFSALVLAAFVLVSYYADPILLQFAVYLPIVFGLPVSLVLGYQYWTSVKSGTPNVSLLRSVLAIIGTAALIGFSIPVNRWFMDQAETDAKEFVIRVGPLLDAYQSKHGTYPVRLDDLPSRPSLPRLLKPDCYYGDLKTYRFNFCVPGGTVFFWDYESETKQWYQSS